MAYQNPPSDPDPTTATGVIVGFVEGIALALLNQIVVVLFSQLATIQQSLNPETTVVKLGTIFTIWGIVYFLFAYVVPIVAAYVWAAKAGIAVYCVGWVGTTIFLNGRFNLGLILLLIASLLVTLVDIIKDSGENPGRRKRPPIR